MRLDTRCDLQTKPFLFAFFATIGYNKVMKRIGVFTDVHGNLAALEAVLAMLDALHCDEILHLGDVVDIGPHSRACLEILLARKDVTCLLGNHDRDFVLNATETRHLSHVSGAHKKQVYGSLDEQMRQAVKNFPLFVKRNCGGQKLLFCHYALVPAPFDWKVFPFMPLQNLPSVEVFDEIFAGTDADAVFFGHKHEPCEFHGRALYVDVGSVGCHSEPFARAATIDYDDNSWSYTRVQAPYDLEEVHRRMHEDTVDGDALFDYYFLHKTK